LAHRSLDPQGHRYVVWPGHAGSATKNWLYRLSTIACSQ
jgi:hypothetical protein